ncbi:L-glyceraldehyde 3-phosphate reductase [Enhydrobacter aerosaccus]|uniref:L-glyceraldehyde 3-phosphate reductase n=1 Tax=Enhydrobacter aerosaccus TaxID=225324 RepID=A0A1T4K314_9HYPH|nr:aldo/keto reductase [Enhydrobacter aerosaccus]SJZ36677.1 L-glyceraldehyde 3-phosphate reductase [Enhydrobacter aerosaccus]
MQKRRLGRTNLDISVLGFGAGAVGGLMTKGTPGDQERALARALELGINYIDTAPLYGNGESERNLGRILKVLKPDVVIGTKVRLKAADRGRIGDFVAQSLDESLHRLGRDHVDLFQLHNPLVARDADDHLAIDIALNEVVPAMQRLQKAGKTRFIGFSGVGETDALLKAIASGAFDTMQVVYNLLNPSAGQPMPKGAPGQDYNRLLERTKAMDMGTIVIRALAGGALAGTTERHPLAMQQVAPIGSAANFVEDVARAKALEPLVKQGLAESLTELAQRFVIANPTVTTMLVGYSTLEQLEQAAAAVEKGPLPAEVLKRINHA